MSVQEETGTNGGKKYTITGPSITSEDGSVTIQDNTDSNGKKIGYKLSVNADEISKKLMKTEVKSGDESTAIITSETKTGTNTTIYKVNVKDMHVEAGTMSYDKKGQGTLALKYKDGKEVKVEGI